jgi:hypothetical protein
MADEDQCNSENDKSIDSSNVVFFVLNVVFFVTSQQP